MESTGFLGSVEKRKILLLPGLEPTIVAYKLITCNGVVFCRGLCEMVRS